MTISSSDEYALNCAEQNNVFINCREEEIFLRYPYTIYYAENKENELIHKNNSRLNFMFCKKKRRHRVTYMNKLKILPKNKGFFKKRIAKS